VHYAACLLLLAVWAFDRLVLPAVATNAPQSLRERWHVLEWRWSLFLMPVIAISGIAWFMQVCVNMSGLSFAEAMHPDIVRTILGQTSFGRVWEVRSIIWLCCGPLYTTFRMPRIFRTMSGWINMLLAAALVSSLAWAGHGQDGGRWHLLADAIHLFTAGLWPMGLAPLAVMLFELRKRSTDDRRALARLVVFRFSGLSLLCVVLLAGSGIVNSFYMIGTLGNLISTVYGKVLLCKVGIFLIILVIAAINRLRLMPRLAGSVCTTSSWSSRVAVGPQGHSFAASESAPARRPLRGDAIRSDVACTAESAARKLRWNVAAELILGITVLIVTAVLGLLATPHP